jgi:tRNA threonylcarbamoyladenosine modification (KEOPS) complex  Pcc1 subunit
MFDFESEIKFDSKEKAKCFLNSIEPELGEEFSRSKTKILRKKEKIFVKINASDKASMRASLNAIMKPINLFSKMEAIK